MPRIPRVSDPPEGFLLTEALIDRAEEAALIEILEALEFQEIRMRGQVAKRTARHYGVGYRYEERTPVPGEPLPDWLASLRERSAGLAGVLPDALAEALVQRYPVGATIGWHRDAPSFGIVVGVSLGSACRMRFRRGREEERVVFEVELEPRSAYVLSGQARWRWEHSIPPTPATRYSVTFRTLR
jgi:alkylated DNA repair dioxygenase AlkB